MASSNKRRKVAVDDEDGAYVDPSETARQPRPSYESSRAAVEAAQNMQRTASGNWTYESVITPGTWHKLDSRKREEVKRSAKKAHKAPKLQKPALDHGEQFAALKQVYASEVQAERAKGLVRTSSFDLFDAFKNATKDPSNLRLLSRQEHLDQGGTKRANQFSAAELKRAQAIFQSHLPSTPGTPQQQQLFSQQRPKAAYPAPTVNLTPVKRSLRSTTASTSTTKTG